MKKRPVMLLLILLLCAAAAFALAGCGPNTLLLVTDQSKEAVEQLVAPYTEKSGVKVEVVQVDGVEELLLAAGVDDQRGGQDTATPAAANPVADLLLTQDLYAVAALRMSRALAQYAPPNASGLPSGARGQGYWYGFGGRGWVLARNTDLAPSEKLTDSFDDLANDALPAKSVGIPNLQNFSYYPLAIYTFWGQQETLAFYQTLLFKEAQINISPEGVANMLADGRLALGVTTYANAKQKKDAGAPVDFGFPDNQQGEIGSYVALNCVALPAASKRQELAQALEDYLLSPEAEALSIKLGLSDVAMRENDQGAPVVRPIAVAPDKVAASAQNAESMLRQLR